MGEPNLVVRLTVRHPDGAELDASLRISNKTPASQVASALARFAGWKGPVYAVSSRTRSVFDDRPIAALGLTDGDTVVLAPFTPKGGVGPIAPVDFSISTPRRPSVSWPLATGRYVVGRDSRRANVVVDDDAVSGTHAEVNVDGIEVTVEDLKSTNGTEVAGRELAPGSKSVLKLPAQLKMGNTRLGVAASLPQARASTATSPRILFNRPPRSLARRAPSALVVPAPPVRPTGTRIPIAASVVPIILAGVLFVVNPSNPLYALVLLASPAIAVASWLEERRSGSGQYKEAEGKFRERVARAQGELEAESQVEKQSLLDGYPDWKNLLSRATLSTPGLWERRPADDDFLRLRVGTFRTAPSSSLQVAPGGDEGLRNWAAEEFASVPMIDIPATVDLEKSGSIGLAGSRTDTTDVVASLLVQAATLHSPRDLLIGGVIGTSRQANLEWVKWLPHGHPPYSPLQVPLFADAASAQQWITDVRRLMAERAGRTRGLSNAEQSLRPALLLIVDSDAIADRAPVAAVLGSGLAASIFTLWLGDRPEDLPGDCRSTLVIDGSGVGVVRNTVEGSHVDGIAVEGVDAGVATRFARALAPLVDVAADQATGALPSSLGLIDALRAQEPLDGWVSSQWRSPGQGLLTSIGATTGGDLTLDIERQGPHGLLAGTTGSGKSELLQAIVAGLAVRYPPSRVNFLLVDYKGGTAFRECAAMPHTVGLVTDLDAGLTRRALASLNAEIRRREQILSQSEAKDVRTIRARSPDGGLPSLLIVVDEFAALHRELPEFLTGLIDVAQRGRALGVHLLLATQSPTGIVSSAISANIAYRIALRTADPTESREVIGSDVAARVPDDRPGRGYVRFASREPVLFQAAYPGDRQQRDETMEVLDVRPFTLFATDKAASETTAPRSARTDLARLVQATQKAATDLGTPAPHRPWLTPLPTFVPVASFDGQPAGAPIGLVDEPDLQRQSWLTFDLVRDAGLLVFGAAGAGKTTILTTMSTGLASRASTEDLQIYGLDFGAGGLRGLEALPHVGSVVRGNDVERGSRLLRWLAQQIADRRTMAATQTGDGSGRPRLLILIDGLEGFLSTYDGLNRGEFLQAFPGLVADGRAVGVHFAITALRRAGTPAWLPSAFERRILLRQTDPDDFLLVGIHLSDGGRQLPAGRGFTESGREVQIAMLGDGSNGTAAVELEQVGARLAQQFERVHSIGSLPGSISGDALPAPIDDGIPIGVGESKLDIDFVRPTDGQMIVLGPPRSGKTNLLELIAAQCRRSSGTRYEVHLLNPRRSPTTSTPFDRFVAGLDDCVKYLSEAEWRNSPGEVQVVLLVDDADELMSALEHPESLGLARRRGTDGPWVVLTMETDAARRIYSDFWTGIKRERHALLLRPDQGSDGDILNIQLPRRPDLGWPSGRGYLIRRGSFEVVQVARA